MIANSNYLIILLIAVLLSCSNATNEDTSKKKTNEYPVIVDSLGVQHLYDKTKWTVYIAKCTDTPKAENGQYILNPAKGFGSYELKFDSLVIRRDTLSFYFDFYENDTNVISVINYREMANSYVNGLMFYENMDSFEICYVSNHSYFIWDCIGVDSEEIYDTTTHRYLKPLQPEVIQYINDNKKDLHPWFYNEAKKRGVIK